MVSEIETKKLRYAGSHWWAQRDFQPSGYNFCSFPVFSPEEAVDFANSFVILNSEIAVDTPAVVVL